MRISIFIFILLSLLQPIQAQERTMSGPNETGETKNKEIEEDVINVESKIRAWTLSKQYSTKQYEVVDSATIGFHNYVPMFKQSISNTYLGFAGSPYQSNIFFDRTNENEFYFLQNFDAYRTIQSEVKYYNTTTPYASLTYEQAKQGTNKTEQKFIAFFTQNIDSVTNFGFEFNVLKTPGQYLYQEASHKHLNLFVSRNTERLNSYVSVMSASDYLYENGGITDSTVNRFASQSIIFTPISFQVRKSPSDFNVNLLNGIENNYKTISAFTSHEYLM